MSFEVTDQPMGSQQRGGPRAPLAWWQAHGRGAECECFDVDAEVLSVDIEHKIIQIGIL